MASSAQELFDPRKGERWNPAREQAELLASTLPPLLVAAEQLASTIVLGVHGRRKAGMGESFWQFRRYSIEDPSTAIDWRQSAKSQHLFVREREWEAAESVWFWRDGSPGMRFSSATSHPTKAERATVLTLALASLLVRGGERIALLGSHTPPKSGRVALRRIAHNLADLPPGDDSLPPAAVMSRQGSLVWISDFLDPLDVIESRMRGFANAGVRGFLAQMIDPAEEDFPYSGRVRFEAPSISDTQMFGRTQNVRANYRMRYKAHAEAIGQMARRLGWTFLRHRTDRPAQTALIALYGAIGGARARRGF
jgi:uncharacterized protein (DUF58 family)